MFIFPCLMACSETDKASKTIDRTPTIPIETDLVIGRDDAPDSLEYILGEPVAVRTDEAGNIYIADRASLTVKVFDANGNYLRSMGGRGRGPTEFHDINFMERTPEGHFLFLDRGNLRYTTLTKSGEFVSGNTINLADQFYLKGVEYYDDKLLALYLKTSLIDKENPREHFSREFFHTYSPDLQTRYASFGPFHLTGITETFPWNMISTYNGSFDLTKSPRMLVFSLGIYTGSLYVFREKEEHHWELDTTWTGTSPHAEPYLIYETEEQYNAAADYPGATWLIFSGTMGRGKLNSLDAGIFYLPAREQIVHFYAEWREVNKTLEEGNLLDLSVQVFDLEGNILDQSYLLSMKYGRQYFYNLVNWMDEQENFYLLDYSNGEPAVRRFTLDLPGKE